MQEIRQHFSAADLDFVIMRLSDYNMYTFAPVGNIITARNSSTFPMMLFLGEQGVTQSWAILRISTIKANEVIAININTETGAALHRTSFDKLTIAGPLSAIAASKVKHQNDRLKITNFIRYLFLKHNEGCVAIHPSTNLNILESAVKHMARIYLAERK